jgi:hypothetical protein
VIAQIICTQQGNRNPKRGRQNTKCERHNDNLPFKAIANLKKKALRCPPITELSHEWAEDHQTPLLTQVLDLTGAKLIGDRVRQSHR